jgi:hypothetical protein
MKPLLAVICVLVPVCAFAGPKQITVTIHSSPAGAAVYANDARTYMGVTPLNLVYPMDGSKNCQLRQGLAVRWASGASEELQRVTLCPSVGKRQTLTLARPADAPNLRIDLQVELQRQELALLSAEAQAQATQRIIDNIRYWTPPPTRPVSCYSYSVGRRVFTNCY